MIANSIEGRAGVFLAELAALAVAYLSPISGMVHAVLLLIAADWLTGVYASRKEKKKITSRGFRKTVEKFVLYTLAIVTTYLVETEIAEFRMANVVAGYVALTELKSIFENIVRITGRNVMNEIYFVLMGRFRAWIGKPLPETTDNENKEP